MPATSTVSAKDDASNKDSYQQISRFNTDFYQESTPSTTNHRGGNQQVKYFVLETFSPINTIRMLLLQKNHRYTGSHFGLKSEETRWSGSSFQPNDPATDVEEDTVEDNEPMIVTAQSYSDQVMKFE